MLLFFCLLFSSNPSCIYRHIMSAPYTWEPILHYSLEYYSTNEEKILSRWIQQSTLAWCIIEGCLQGWIVTTKSSISRLPYISSSCNVFWIQKTNLLRHDLQSLLNRMIKSDDGLCTNHSFPCFQQLVTVNCDGSLDRCPWNNVKIYIQRWGYYTSITTLLNQ